MIIYKPSYKYPMKQLLFLLSLSMLLLSGGCQSRKQQASEVAGAGDSILSAVLHSSLLDDTALPRSIDLQQDISRYSYQELRLLRSYPYAIHGYYFMEADIQSFFMANTKWYASLVDTLYWESEEGKGVFYTAYDQVPLTSDEKAFVRRVDERLKELGQSRWVTIDGHALANPAQVVNLFQFKDMNAEMANKMTLYNFFITKGSNEQLFHVYEENDYRQVPNFITTDLYLQAFHIYFAYVLKSLEKQRFLPTLEALCRDLHDVALQYAGAEVASLKDAAEYAATFYAIPYMLLTGKTLDIPERYREAFRQELDNIRAHQDAFSDFLEYRDVYFPYSLFRPRGHYAHDAQSSSYFRAMMWMQTACFCREDEAQLKRAVFQAFLLKEQRGAYESIYRPLSFLMGEPDNLSFDDILQVLQHEGITQASDALSTVTIGKVNRRLGELGRQKNRIRPKIELSCRDKINFMPQRYLADNEVLQDMVDTTPNSRRAYPKGLDVFAALGVPSAERLLDGFYKEPENWASFAKELEQLQQAFKKQPPLASPTVYNRWMESLVTMQHADKAYPSFMQTAEWGYKNLNTALASWAELKHDALLYGEQPVGAECGGGGPPPPIVVGYVEPNLAFWQKLKALADTTHDLLQTHGCLTEDLKGKTEQLQDYIGFLIRVTEKELKGEKLAEQEYRTIQYMGSSIEYFTLSILEPEKGLPSWSFVKGPDKSVAVVADVYTRNVPDCGKNGVLHVATGKANNLYVVVEIGGNLYLTRGATFSYYEFVCSPGTRLTDEEWQQMLDDGKAPAVQEWMRPILIDHAPEVDERVFYGSGC